MRREVEEEQWLEAKEQEGEAGKNEGKGEEKRERGETGAERGGSWIATSQTPFSPQRLPASLRPAGVPAAPGGFFLLRALQAGRSNRRQ